MPACLPEKCGNYQRMNSARTPNWQHVINSVRAIGGQGTLQEVREHFKTQHPDRNPINVRHELVMMSVNHPKRIHYPQAKKQRRSDTGNQIDALFFQPDGIYELYAPAKHGVWEIFLDDGGLYTVRRLKDCEATTLPAAGETQKGSGINRPRPVAEHAKTKSNVTNNAIPNHTAASKDSSISIDVPCAKKQGDETPDDSLNTILSAITSLSSKYPIFHSEAHFQHALAMEMGRLSPDTTIQLEIPSLFREKRASIDMRTQHMGKVRFIELKYKKTKCDVIVNDERFLLKHQGANDQGASDFIKDICRIEAFVDVTSASEGFAILLTNDRSYWRDSFKPTAIDREFKLTEGREIHGTLSWLTSAGSGSLGKREASLHLRGRYRLQWRDYSDLSVLGVKPFKFLCVHIKARSM